MTNLISMDKRYKTRDGEDARILCTDNTCGGIWKVVAVVNGNVNLYTDNGRFNSCGVSSNDLIEVMDEKELWVEVYNITKDNKTKIRSFAYASHEALQLGISANILTLGEKYELVATKKVTYVEGESCL